METGQKYQTASMDEKEKRPLGIFVSDEIRKMIVEHPELPIVFSVQVDEFSGEYAGEYASRAIARIGEILDCCQTVNDERCYDDRDDFESDLKDSVDFSMPREATDEEIEQEYQRRLAEYEPFWKRCISIHVGN